MNSKWIYVLFVGIIGVGCMDELQEPVIDNESAVVDVGAIRHALVLTEQTAEVTVLGKEIKTRALRHSLPYDVLWYDAVETQLAVTQVVDGVDIESVITVVDLARNCGTFESTGEMAADCFYYNEDPTRDGSAWQVGMNYVVMLGNRPGGVGVYDEDTKFTVLRFPIQSDGFIDGRAVGLEERVSLDRFYTLLATARK